MAIDGDSVRVCAHLGERMPPITGAIGGCAYSMWGGNDVRWLLVLDIHRANGILYYITLHSRQAKMQPMRVQNRAMGRAGETLVTRVEPK